MVQEMRSHHDGTIKAFITGNHIRQPNNSLFNHFIARYHYLLHGLVECSPPIGQSQQADWCCERTVSIHLSGKGQKMLLRLFLLYSVHGLKTEMMSMMIKFPLKIAK